VRQQRVFLQFFQCQLGVVVVHKLSPNVDQNDCTRCRKEFLNSARF
jgi:hypothetical protein